jgi:Pyruvate/2-oxoacid:ferredoxin oxidoreductase delta subunit
MKNLIIIRQSINPIKEVCMWEVGSQVTQKDRLLLCHMCRLYKVNKNWRISKIKNRVVVKTLGSSRIQLKAQ